MNLVICVPIIAIGIHDVSSVCVGTCKQSSSMVKLTFSWTDVEEHRYASKADEGRLTRTWVDLPRPDTAVEEHKCENIGISLKKKDIKFHKCLSN
jgi:hypothetical protein